MDYKIMESNRTHREKDSLQRTKSQEHPDILESLELGNRASNKLFGTVLQQNANGDRGTSLRQTAMVCQKDDQGNSVASEYEPEFVL